MSCKLTTQRNVTLTDARLHGLSLTTPCMTRTVTMKDTVDLNVWNYSSRQDTHNCS